MSETNGTPIIESIICSVHEVADGEFVCGLSIEWSDGVYTYGFCDPRDVDSYLWELTEAREAQFSAGKEVND